MKRWNSVVFVMSLATIIAGFASPGSMAYGGIGRSGDVVPADPATWTSSTEAYIGQSGTGSVSVDDDSDVVARTSYLGYESGSDGAATVSGDGSTWTNSDVLYVGFEGEATMEITDGGVVRGGSGFIGAGAESRGAVTVSGLDSQWINSSGVTVGDSGHGALDIIGGGTVSSLIGRIGVQSGSTGAVRISGAGSTWSNDILLIVGYQGSVGTLEVTNGAVVVSNAIGGIIGADPGSRGEVTVSGAGSTWTSSSLEIGASGEGRLDIIDGGAVSSSRAEIRGTRGVVTVTGVGSTWTSGSLEIGASDEGRLDIADGGAVSSSGATIGGAGGEVTVTGAGSIWTTGSLDVGFFGEGTLNIIDGGVVSSEGGVLGQFPTSSSRGATTVTGVGSIWTNSDSLFVGIDGVGELHIGDGGLVTVGGRLHVDHDGDGDSFITMTGGGMLALAGETDASGSLSEFLALISVEGGSDEIRYWDDSISDWSHISNSTPGEDYILEYFSEGDLAGYTVLTVPEPATMSLLAIGGLAVLRRRSPWRRRFLRRQFVRS